jgi:hypothetical protein
VAPLSARRAFQGGGAGASQSVAGRPGACCEERNTMRAVRAFTDFCRQSDETMHMPAQAWCAVCWYR